MGTSLSCIFWNSAYYYIISTINYSTLFIFYSRYKLVPCLIRCLSTTGLEVGVVDLFDISNFDVDKFESAISGYDGIVSMEEGFRGRGGVDSMLFEFISRRHLNLRVLNIGVQGGYRFELGSREELHEQVGIGQNYVYENITSFIKSL